MEARDVTLGDVFDTKVRYEIPIFQRPYVWDEERNWTSLWNDLRHAAELAESTRADSDDGLPPRELFLGALVTQSRPPVPKRTPTHQVIDGQQRMTTLQVFLAAAHRVAHELDADDAALSFETLVRNRVPKDSEFPGDQYKVWPLPADRIAFEWAVRLAPDGRPAPDAAHRIVRAAKWFEDAVRAWALEADDSTERLDMLHFALTERVKVVAVFLDQRDDPQVIFEALNDKGERLAAADLVKNLLFQRLAAQGDRALEHDLHERHWKPLDQAGWRTDVTTGRITRARVDTLLAYWLSAQVADLVSVEHLYADFKAWLSTARPTPRAADVIVDVRRWADTMDELLARPMTDPVRQVLDRIEATNTTTPWPILLFLHASDGVPRVQQEIGAAALDSYLMRRAMCRMTGKDYNRLFGGLLRVLRATDPAIAGEVLRDELARQSAEARRWPTDSEFVTALWSDDVYNTVHRSRLRSLLVGLDTALITARGERVDPLQATRTSLTIEHILPQQWEKHWPLPDGEDPVEAAAKRTRHVHQLGNLTLTTSALNSGMRNDPWVKKRPTLQKHSLLRLTTASVLTVPTTPASAWAGPRWEDDWDESRIAWRSMWLINLALRTWTRPEPAESAQEDAPDD